MIAKWLDHDKRAEIQSLMGKNSTTQSGHPLCWTWRWNSLSFHLEFQVHFVLVIQGNRCAVVLRSLSHVNLWKVGGTGWKEYIDFVSYLHNESFYKELLEADPGRTWYRTTSFYHVSKFVQLWPRGPITVFSRRKTWENKRATKTPVLHSGAPVWSCMLNQVEG